MLGIVFLVIMFILGAVFGSFACCQAWRIYYKENKKKKLGRWSVCLKCGHRLRWYENIPIISWLVLRGKCRKCGEKIGVTEILSEIGLGVVFVLVGIYFFGRIFSSGSATVPGENGYGSLMFFGENGYGSLMLFGDDGYGSLMLSENAIFESLKMVMILVSIIIMWILLIYDAKWGELPVVLLGLVNIIAVLYLGLRIIEVFSSGVGVNLLGVVGAIGILAGVYYLLYFFSGEKLVGGGDWLLCLAIAVILGHWFLALVVLFLSNFLASIVGILMMMMNKKERKSQIAFGPFLVLAFVAVYVFQDLILKMMIII